MAYKQESIKKMIETMGDTMRKYARVPLDRIPLCISSGNRKIGRVMNVSLPPVLSCGNCGKCKYFCYDIKACLQYPGTVIDARIRNWTILKRDREEYFRRIEEKISRRRRNKYFRWHVSGDLIDRDYLENVVQIAKRHPDFTFWTYTKMYGLVNEYVADGGRIPGNLSIMFSEWDGVPVVNPYGFPVFSCRMKAGNKNHGPEYFRGLYKCPGNCDVCKSLHRGCIAGENTFADEH